MRPVSNPDVFTWGAAVGVLGLLWLLCLLVGLTSGDNPLLCLAGNLALMLALVLADLRLPLRQERVQRWLLVLGPR